MGEVLELAERAWQGELEETQVHPGAALVGFEELGAGFGFMSAFSNVAALDTGDGLVFLDTSSLFHAAKLHQAIRAWSPARVHTAVYTHGHVDHVFGLAPFEAEATEKGWPKTRVLAHEACPARFDRYRLTHGYNAIINQRQFNFPKPVFPEQYRYPDETVAAERPFTVGTCDVQLFHDKGETDDHLWAWLPGQRALYTGDLFIWAAPNCGNPQKVQRYPLEWAGALRRMQKLGAEWLLPGHGPPIQGSERVATALSESAELLETICEQTLAMMNQGLPLNEILHAVEIPERLISRPYLRPSYDDPRFIVRNLWRLYGGWYDGNPAHLNPAPDAALGRAIAALCGGASALAAAAEKLATDGELDVACHLIEHAAAAAPDDPAVHGVRAELYRRRRQDETSLMAKGIYGAAVRASRERAGQGEDG